MTREEPVDGIELISVFDVHDEGERRVFAGFGFFRFDLVAFLFGDMTWLSRIIYALVGLAGLYLLSLYGRISQSMEETA